MMREDRPKWFFVSFDFTVDALPRFPASRRFTYGFGQKQLP